MTVEEKPIDVTRRFLLTAGETDAQGCMPMSLIIERSIELATEHANLLGIGYDRLIKEGASWVLSRVSVKMERYPRINDYYYFTTWIEGYNRLYSDRCFAIADAEGREIGHVRSMWVAMDLAKRTAIDLTALEQDSFPVCSRQCPIPKQRKQPPLKGEIEEREYIFRYSDIDFNRHVNTIQYVRRILNHWSLEHFDHNQIDAFDIAFHHECHYGDRITIRTQTDTTPALCEIVRDGTRCVGATVAFKPRS